MRYFTCLLLFCHLSEFGCDQIERKLFPIKYDLTVTPYFETESEFWFEGKLIFFFKPLRHHTAQTLSLHSDGLKIQSLVLFETSEGLTTQMEFSSEQDAENQLLNIDAGYPLSVDKTYELHINYTGTIWSDGWGLYKDSYEHEGRKRFYIVTQLRPVFARRLFPCLDEPSYKARFTIRVWRPPQYTSLSNMPRVDTSPKNLLTGRVLDTFAETPLMSTFLVALAVLDFSSTSSSDGRYSSWAIPSKINLTLHGHRRVAALVEAMEAITGSEFPVPKLDQLALPQLNPVAMENWGLNTYRERNMLFKEGNFAPKVRQDIPRFTAHEISHHWLGNLVTLQWWDWLWISEMYAMYYEYYLPSQIEPSWRMLDQIIVELYIPGLLEDSFNNSRPLTTRVSSNQEILAKFSGVTYTKGPALLHMINNFMTPLRAEQGLRLLLKEKQYGTVDPEGLWQIYNKKAVGLPADMGTIMDSWTDQPGYPLVTALVNQAEGSVILKQERFLSEGTANESYLWWIPVTYTSGIRPNFTHAPTRLWLSPQKPITTLKLGSRIDSWLIFNVQHIGFYRVNYDVKNWKRLIETLHSNPAGIHELNRVQLLDDSFSLARAGQLSYTVPLELMAYMRREGCYLPWAGVLPSINFLLARLNGLRTYETFKDYLRELIAPTFDSVGFYLRPSDPHLLQMHRVQVVTLACSVGLLSCVRDAQQQEQLISQNKSFAVVPGLEFVQLCTVLESGVHPDHLFSQRKEWGPEDQLRAMPCAANKTFLIRYLSTSLGKDSAVAWGAKLTAVLSRLTNIDTAFNFLADQYPTLLERFGARNVSAYYIQVGNSLTTNDQLAMVEALKNKALDGEVIAALRTVSSSLIQRIKWIETYSPTIQSWLNNYKRNTKLKVQGSLLQCY